MSDRPEPEDGAAAFSASPIRMVQGPVKEMASSPVPRSPRTGASSVTPEPSSTCTVTSCATAAATKPMTLTTKAVNDAMEAEPAARGRASNRA